MQKFSFRNMAATFALFVKFGVFATVSVILFSGCTKEYYTTYEEYYTTCNHDFAVVDTYYYTVKPGEWREEPAPNRGDGPYLFTTYRLSKITANVIENGVILCYLIDDNGRDNVLPYLRPWGFNSFNEPYSQNVRFDVEQGLITFIIEASDLEFPYRPSGNMRFKISVIQNYRH